MFDIEKEVMGMCAFCESANHAFPDDEWHNSMHERGWHGCDVYGGFRFKKQDCYAFELMRDAVMVGM